MPTFTYEADNSLQLSVKPRVLTTKFGDGYQQRVGDGINISPRKYSLTFNTRTDAEIAPILSFLQAQNSITSFSWTPPNASAGKWITPDGWTHSKPKYGINDLSVTFEEVFE